MDRRTDSSFISCRILVAGDNNVVKTTFSVVTVGVVTKYSPLRDETWRECQQLGRWAWPHSGWCSAAWRQGRPSAGSWSGLCSNDRRFGPWQPTARRPLVDMSARHACRTGIIGPIPWGHSGPLCDVCRCRRCRRRRCRGHRCAGGAWQYR